MALTLGSMEQSQAVVCLAIRHIAQGKKKVCSYSNTIKVKERGKKVVLPALRMHSKYKTPSWIAAGPVLFCMVWGCRWEERKTHPADILQPVGK